MAEKKVKASKSATKKNDDLGLKLKVNADKITDAVATGLVKSRDTAVKIGGAVQGKAASLPKVEIKRPSLPKKSAIKTDKKPIKAETKEKIKFDDQLRLAVDEYNLTYATFSDHGTQLLNQRERAVDLLENVTELINSIANHPKEFDTDIADIQIGKKTFKDVCDYAKTELEAAQKSAMSAGAGVAGGAAVASLAPSAAMWIATTFGTASTGTAISALSGAAATNAALAWLGGGALATGGGGMAAGSAFLALAGPVGWGLAGATLLTSIALFANKKVKLSKEKKEEIEAVLKNTEQLREVDLKLNVLLEKTITLRKSLREQYSASMPCFADDFTALSQEQQYQLGTLVNNAKSLSATLGESI